MPLLHHQPFKGFYVAEELVTTLCLRVPFWIVWSIPRSNRIRPSWSVFRCVFIYFLRRYFLLNFRSGGILNSPNHLAIRGGKNVNGVWIDPAPNAVLGDIRARAEAAGIEYVRIPGYWFVKRNAKLDLVAPIETASERVVYSLHGGGFVRFSAHPSDPLATIPQGIVDHCKTISRILSLEYRLSDLKDGRAVHPFPTALLDAIAGYRYLVNELHYLPENIVLEGDSAGGNLALALCRYLIENPEAGLAPPGALLLISPWTDLGLSHITPGSSALPAKPADVLGPTKYGPGTSHFSVQAYLGPDNVSTLAETDVFISPASLNIQRVDFKGFPKTLIISGDADLLYDQIKTLYHRMAQDLGEQVEYYEAKDAVHDFVSMEPFEPERTAALQKIASWVDVSS